MAMTANQDIPQELHIKICKKIAQLTKVIYTLNTKAEEHDSIIEKLNEEHGKEIQSVMSLSRTKIEKFKNDCKYSSEKEKELKNIQEMLKQVKQENERLQKSLREYLTNTELNEKQLRNGYENKFLDLQNKFLERKRDYSELLDSLNKYDAEDTKQKEIIELTLKHNEQVSNMKHAFERDLNLMKADKLQSENILNEKIQSLESLQDQVSADNKLLEGEYELKITKLKQFYEEELKLHESRNNKENEKEWLTEKANIISEFQLTKTELNNRIRFLEKTLGEKGSAAEELEKKLHLMQSEFDVSLESISCLENNVTMKDKEISILKDEIKVLQNKTKVLGEKFYASSMCNDNYKQIEEAYGEVSRKLDDHKNKLTSLMLEYSQLEDIHHQLRSKLLQVEEDNTKLRNICTQKTNEKTTEMNKNKTLEKQFEEKSVSINSLEKKLATLEIKYKSEKDQCALMQQRVDDMKDMFIKANTKLKETHNAELNKEKKLHAENIKQVHEESSILLKSKMEDFQKEREKAEEEYNKIIQSKDDLLKTLTVDFDRCKSSLDMTRSNLEQNAEKNRVLKSGLHDKGKMMADKFEQYEQKISDMKVEFQAEKDKMKLEFEKVKIQIADEHNGILSKLEKKWQQKLKTASEEHEQFLKQREKKVESQLNIILSKHHSELYNLKLVKDGEIQGLKKEIEAFKSSIEKLKSDSCDAARRHDQVLAEKVEYFKAEKNKLMQLHKNEIIELKKSMGKEMDEKIQGLEIEKNHALEALKCAHEAAVIEIRHEHLHSVKALRNQLNQEKEESVGLLRSQLSNDKEKLHAILKVQAEEKISAITRDFEAQLEDSKAELERTYELRQQEFLVHSRKISELTKDLEEEKKHAALQKDKLDQAEQKEKYLNNELTTKGEEILEIRRESNFRMRSEIDKLGNAHRKEKEHMSKEYHSAKVKDYEEWEGTKSELGDQVSSLKMLLDEVEDKFMKRPSRDEDIEKVNNLTQKLFERDIECRRLSEERKHYRLELVNREENFNKVFNNSPNVGYINPIELSKRKSSKKR